VGGVKFKPGLVTYRVWLALTHPRQRPRPPGPGTSGKVGGFRQVETVVEAGVVAARERNYELASAVQHLDWLS
jgi:hypothetical protein